MCASVKSGNSLPPSHSASSLNAIQLATIGFCFNFSVKVPPSGRLVRLKRPTLSMPLKVGLRVYCVRWTLIHVSPQYVERPSSDIHELNGNRLDPRRRLLRSTPQNRWREVGFSRQLAPAASSHSTPSVNASAPFRTLAVNSSGARAL
jgi:hypothetical protein